MANTAAISLLLTLKWSITTNAADPAMDLADSHLSQFPIAPDRRNHWLADGHAVITIR
jgi:hypothetical protein